MKVVIFVDIFFVNGGVEMFFIFLWREVELGEGLSNRFIKDVDLEMKGFCDDE